MNINKNFIGSRMNKSLDERLVPAGEYLDALNVRISSDEDGEAGSAENAKGNEKLTTLTYNGSNIPSDAKCIGAYQDGRSETIYWFVTSSTVDMIVSYNERTKILLKHVVSETVLNFSSEHLITGINLVDDLLFFTDNFNPPRKINVTRSYPEPDNGTDQITENDISVIVKPPVTSPKIALSKKSNDKNYIEDKFIRFAYRFKYKDGEYSALSQFSDLAFDPGAFSLDYGSMVMKGMRNSKNTVDVTFNTGGEDVVGIDLCFKTSISNIINIVERFDKEEKGWNPNDDVTITFDNQKIYTALPESELLRLYDNVPKKAKSQTVMGNRIMYGNYVDGYDIDTVIDYDVELVTSDVGLSRVPDSAENGDSYTIDSSIDITNSTLVLDFTGLELVKGGSLNIDLNIQHDSFGGDASYVDGNETQNDYQEPFEFVFPRDYENVQDLATDQDFIDAIQSSLTFDQAADGYSLTDLFYAQIVANTGWTADGGGITSATGDFKISYTTHKLKLQVPAVRYEDDSNPGTYAYEYFAMSSTTASLNKISIAGSLHSNMDYEVGIVYMDEYNRASTALVSSNNTAFVPPKNSTEQNKLRATIKNTAPSWAKRYRMVLKPSKGEYQTIYSYQYYYDKTEAVWWVKLDGDNRTKCKVGDTLIVKVDTGGALSSEVRTKVLDLQTQVKGFLDDEGNIPPNGGVYMKLRPVGYGINKEEGGDIDYGNKHAVNKDVLYPAYRVIEGTPNTYEEYTIPAGSQVKFYFDAIRRGKSGESGSRSYRFDGTFVATRDYDNLYDFIVSENINFEEPTNDPVAESNDDTKPTGEWNASIGDENDFFALGAQANDQKPEDGHNNIYIDGYGVQQGLIKFRYFRHSSSGKAWLGVEAGGRRASGNNYRMNLHIQVFSSGGLLVFETEPQPNEFELYYEGSDSFEITPEGYHKGNVTDQSASADAVVDINIFNCFSFGNGVESFRIEDGFATPSFKIGERVTSVSEQDFKESHRYADITYSGIYNEESNVNRLNEFNLGLVNFKTLEKSFGPIEKMHARQSDILVLQEDKISYLLVGKNLLSDAGGGGAILNAPEVLGNQVARPEEYGISNNPESFSAYGRDVFFTDAKRGAIINIKGGVSQSDQINVISDLGMRSWFRDSFSFNTNKIHLGAYDPYSNEYVLSMTDDSLEVEYVDISCGMTVGQSGSSTAVTYQVELTPVVGNTDVDYSVTSGSVDVVITYNDSEVVNQTSLTGSGTLTFSKSSQVVNTATITITPTNATYAITPQCTEAQTLTVIRIVKNTDQMTDKTIHHEYFWSDNGYTSPVVSDDILFGAGPVTLYESSTGSESFGSIPAEGATVTMRYKKVFGDNADWDHDSFKYLVSDTLYSESDIETLSPLLSEATPVLNPDEGVYEASFTYNNVSDHQYLYLVWDYIEPLIECSDTLTAEGKAGQYELSAELGTNTGAATIEFNSSSVPDRFQIEWNGEIVADSLFVGDHLGTPEGDGYETEIINASQLTKYVYDGSSFVSDGTVSVNFTSSDIADSSTLRPTTGDGSVGNQVGVVAGYPIGDPLASDGNVKLTFDKTTAYPTTVKIIVTGVASNTGWFIEGIECPTGQEASYLIPDEFYSQTWSYQDDTDNTIVTNQSVVVILHNSIYYVFENAISNISSPILLSAADYNNASLDTIVTSFETSNSAESGTTVKTNKLSLSSSDYPIIDDI